MRTYSQPLKATWFCRSCHLGIHDNGGRPPHPPQVGPLADALSRISAELRALQTDIKNLEAERNQLIRQALNAGWTQAQIMRATGLTRSRIGQLAR